ncbi:hypothetical protein RI367_001717 [Sorochytrium milnesiophthora]
MPGGGSTAKSGKPKRVGTSIAPKSAAAAAALDMSARLDSAAQAAPVDPMQVADVQKREALMVALKMTATELPEGFGEMDEVKLKQKLVALEAELQEYKNKVEICKRENERYRMEIESSHKDSAEYTTYLESKRSEKQAIIDKLNQSHLAVMQNYFERKAELEDQLKARIGDLQEEITALESKLDAKNHDILLLPDILAVKYRNEHEIARYKKEIAELEARHHGELMQLERKLLNERIRIERENEAKVTEMGNAAEEQAFKYLTEYTQQLSQQNIQMEKELKKSIALTKAYQERKEALERRQAELLLERQVRERIVNTRLNQVKRSLTPAADQPSSPATPSAQIRKLLGSRRAELKAEELVTHTLPSFEEGTRLMEQVTDKLRGVSI